MFNFTLTVTCMYSCLKFRCSTEVEGTTLSLRGYGVLDRMGDEWRGYFELLISFTGLILRVRNDLGSVQACVRRKINIVIGLGIPCG